MNSVFRATLILLWCIFSSTFSMAEEPADTWIFSGQSNMKAINGEARRAVESVARQNGNQYDSIYVAESGKPIEAWLDSDHRDYEKLGKRLADEIAAARKNDATFRGFVWYQGESNVNENAGQYQNQLTELVRRIRQNAGNPKLPVIVVQIGAATAYDGRDWMVGVVREAQRRFVESDDRAALVTAIDAEVGDYTVHMSQKGAQTLADRIAAAAQRLAYGKEATGLGPQFESAMFATDDRRHVVVRFAGVSEKLVLSEGWLAGFGASRVTKLPDVLADLQDANELGDLQDDFIYPVGGRQLNAHQLVLQFAKPLPADARLSYAAMRNAQYGPHRRWGLEFGGLTDETGVQSPAFVLAKISPPTGAEGIEVLQAKPIVPEPWRQIAVNCVGRYPEAVTRPQAQAGVEQDRWRQAWWNAASSGGIPNLYDEQGRVTSVGFQSGVWYMSPYFRELKNADDALMASWCKNNTHRFTGLTPGESYDLAIYLLQGPPKKGEAPADERPVRISFKRVPQGKNRKHAVVHRERTVRVPAGGKFEGYTLATAEDEAQGNVVVFEKVEADEQGVIEFAVETSERKGDKMKWGDTTIAGVQIRRAE